MVDLTRKIKYSYQIHPKKGSENPKENKPERIAKCELETEFSNDPDDWTPSQGPFPSD